MPVLPPLANPLGSPSTRARNLMLDAIAAALSAEAAALNTIVAELSQRDALAAADVAALTARLAVTEAAASSIAAEIADPTSLALIPRGQRAAWAPVSGGIGAI